MCESDAASTNPKTVVGRFAPTPSGRLHMGNLFAFLITWIAARQHGGRVAMRIEDLDTSRTKPEFADGIMRDLAWFGLDWDGEVMHQSARTQAYLDALETLESQGLVYPCFCSRADLHSASAPHFGEEYVYQGTCRDLSPVERLQRSEQKKGALRVRVGNAHYEFVDRFQGQQSYDLSQCSGDFIIRRSDEVFAYQLAVVVDDAEQGVSSVVRGVDLMTSTPRQMFLQDALGLPHPEYGHVPILVNAEGKRLAKRDRDASLSYLIEEAHWPAEKILGRIAYRTGMLECDEPIRADQLVAEVDLNRLAQRREIVWA